MRHFNLNLGFLFGLGLAGCQVIVGITDRTTGPDAGTPGGGSDGSGGDGTSGSSSSAGGSGSAGKGTAGSGAVLGGGGGGASGSGSGATAGGGKGGTSGSGSGAAAGRGGAPPGAGGSVVGSGGAGTPPVAGSGESFCIVGGPVGAAGSCGAPLTCTPKPGTFIGVCTAPCATTADCAPGHFCLPTANGSLCVKDCSPPACTSQGFACFTPPSGQPYCLPDPWFFGLKGASCHDDSNCLSNFCGVGGTCIDCVDNTDCNAGPTGASDICGILTGTSNAICFHDCSADPNICSKYFSEPASSCKPVSGTALSTCGY